MANMSLNINITGENILFFLIFILNGPENTLMAKNIKGKNIPFFFFKYVPKPKVLVVLLEKC